MRFLRRRIRRASRGSSRGSRRRALSPYRLAEVLGHDPDERWRLDEVRYPDSERVQVTGRQTATDERIAKRVDDLSESVDARLQSFAMRLAAIEQQLQDQSRKRTREGTGTGLWSRERRELGNAPDEAAVDPRRAVDDALRALSASQPERGHGGE